MQQGRQHETAIMRDGGRGGRTMDARWARIVQQLTMILVVGCIIALAGCATTQVVDQWREPAYRATSPQHVLVIAVMTNPDRRSVLEDALVSRLQERGVKATPSYGRLTVIGPEDLEAVKKLVEQTGSNLVLSIRLIKAQEETHRTYGSGSPPGAYGAMDGGFDRYYPYAWQDAASEVHTHQSYSTEARLFDMKSNNLVWGATMKSGEPSNFKEAAAAYAELVVKQLQHHQLLVGR